MVGKYVRGALAILCTHQGNQSYEWEGDSADILGYMFTKKIYLRHINSFFSQSEF